MPLPHQPEFTVIVGSETAKQTTDAFQHERGSVRKPDSELTALIKYLGSWG